MLCNTGLNSKNEIEQVDRLSPRPPCGPPHQFHPTYEHLRHPRPDRLEAPVPPSERRMCHDEGADLDMNDIQVDGVCVAVRALDALAVWLLTV